MALVSHHPEGGFVSRSDLSPADGDSRDTENLVSVTQHDVFSSSQAYLAFKTASCRNLFVVRRW